MFTLYTILNALDVVITAMGLARGFTEGNPEVARLIEMVGPALGLTIHFMTNEVRISLDVVLARFGLDELFGFDAMNLVVGSSARHAYAVVRWWTMLI